MSESRESREGERAGEARRIVPPAPPEPPPEDALALDVWGFRDTAFRVNDRGVVELTGRRYPLSGCELPDLLPWMERTIDVPLDPHDTRPAAREPEVPAPRPCPGFREEAAKWLGAEHVVDDGRVRLRHGHGHTQEEMYAIKHGTLPRVPDLVLFPGSESEVAALVEAALRHDVVLVPYGGGTNVTEALRCPDEESRPIASVDLARMNRILWIDPVDRMARVEAGAVGRLLAAQLAEQGFTLGHEPDSIELSTLGGWIATHASGMKKNRYGNIEDLVLDVTAVTPSGRLERSGTVPRESIGVDPKRLFLGSEGNLGLITSAVVKLFPAPEVKRFGSILFPSFEEGFRFLYALHDSGHVPASVRLVDNLQFQFGQALKPRAEGAKAWLRSAERLFVTRVKGYDPERMTACTLVFEGDRRSVREQEEVVYRLAKRYGGMKAGAENGERGYQLTFSIAYIRDFAMNHWILGESFETSVPWSRARELVERVRQRIFDEHARRELPGRPFVTARVTQLYETGVCVYFYFAYYFKGVRDPSGVYAEMERAARDEILRSGGSLSHHHGVGKLRRPFLSEVLSGPALGWLAETKRAIDPRGVFGVANTWPPAEDGR